MRKGEVYVGDRFAGIIEEFQDGYRFRYDQDYLGLTDAEPVSLTMPLRDQPYENEVMFPFFDGLIPEGWLLAIAEKSWKLDRRDRMGLLLTCCEDCIGTVRVHAIEK